MILEVTLTQNRQKFKRTYENIVSIEGNYLSMWIKYKKKGHNVIAEKEIPIRKINKFELK